ncbi:MAG TPA: hypothetical protein VN922_03285 [Bacteroidia bacterium]|nr:hypothetical protein [Bacteroidia bacterium]
MKLASLLFISFSLAIVSCKQPDSSTKPADETAKPQVYKSNEIGWSIEMPSGWSIVTQGRLDSLDKKGKDIMEKESGDSIDTKGLKHLASFKKNQFNFFGSTIEPFKEDTAGEYDAQNRALDVFLYNTYVNQGIKTDTSTGTEIVQGLKFNVFNAAIHGPDGNVILRQILYSRLINGYDFGVNINYNNEDDKKVMLDAFKNSKFEKK